MAMTAVGRAAGAVVEEVAQAVPEMPGIMAGTQKPNYARAVDLAHQGGDPRDDRAFDAAGVLPLVLFASSSSSPARRRPSNRAGRDVDGRHRHGLFVASR